MIGCGAALDRMEPWQFLAAWRGYRAAHADPSKAAAPSPEAFRKAVARQAERTLH